MYWYLLSGKSFTVRWHVNCCIGASDIFHRGVYINRDFTRSSFPFLSFVGEREREKTPI